MLTFGVDILIWIVCLRFVLQWARQRQQVWLYFCLKKIGISRVEFWQVLVRFQIRWPVPHSPCIFTAADFTPPLFVISIFSSSASVFGFQVRIQIITFIVTNEIEASFLMKIKCQTTSLPFNRWAFASRSIYIRSWPEMSCCWNRFSLVFTCYHLKDQTFFH